MGDVVRVPDLGFDEGYGDQGAGFAALQVPYGIGDGTVNDAGLRRLGEVTAMDSARFIELTAGLVSAEGRQRELAAESALDLRSDLDDDQARSVALLLAHLAVLEQDRSTRESLLHALAEYVEWFKAPASVADVASALDVADLVGSEVEYLEYIRNPQ